MFQVQWHQKLTELTHRPSLAGGKNPSRQASRANSCCWRLCHQKPCVISMAAAKGDIHSSAAVQKGTVTPAAPDQLCQTALSLPQLPQSLIPANLTQAIITNVMLCSQADFLFNSLQENSLKRENISVTVFPKVLVLQFLWLYYCFTPITCILIPSPLSCNPFIPRLCPVWTVCPLH